jgi:23S rRNA (guanine745-N1)-methyltransferase
MRLAGRHNHDAPCTNLYLAVGAAEGRMSLEHDEDLRVVVSVERRTAAGRSIPVEEGHVRPTVVPALELDRVVSVAQLVESKYLHRPTIGDDARVLANVVDLLRCPVCELALAHGDGVLRCPAGHSFDIARQGYVSLFASGGRTGEADTPAMVEAREAFVRAGHFRPLREALAEEARAAAGGPAASGAIQGRGAILDLGAGSGHHLVTVLDALPNRLGIAVDASPAALRRAARSHPRAAAIGADAWKPLPLRNGIATIVLSVFAPRNPTEMARVLAPGGSLLAVTPTTRHLHELVGPLGLLSVPDDKEDRLDAQLAAHFALAKRRTIEHAMFLTRDESAQLVRMGPSAWHVDEQSVNERLAALPDPLTVTASMTVSSFEPS